MSTYNVLKFVETEKLTESFDVSIFDNLESAEKEFSKRLLQQDTYAGEYNEGEFSEYFNESIHIDILDEDGDPETIKEELVYSEGLMDKNNYKGEYANNYWAISKHNGKELVYNFYDNGKDLNLEYSDVTNIDKWLNN